MEANYLASIGGNEASRQLLEKYKERLEWGYADWLTAQKRTRPTRDSADPALSEAVQPLQLTEKDTKSDEAPSSHASGASSVPPPQSPQLRHLDECLATLRREKEQFDSTNPACVATAYQHAQEALLYLSECSTNPLDEKDFLLIHTTLQETKDLGIQLLIEAIMYNPFFDQSDLEHVDSPLVEERVNKQKENIQILAAFAKHMPNRVLKYVIEFDENQTLALLLNTGAFPVNQYRIETENGEHVSFLKFAFIAQSKLCFKKILEEGASVLELNTDNLPFAHTIWMGGQQDSFYNIFREFYLEKGMLLSLLHQLMATAIARVAYLEDETPQKIALNAAIFSYISSIKNASALMEGDHKPLARYLDRTITAMENADDTPVKALSPKVQGIVRDFQSKIEQIKKITPQDKHTSWNTTHTKLTTLIGHTEKFFQLGFSGEEDLPEVQNGLILLQSINRLFDKVLQINTQSKTPTPTQISKINKELKSLTNQSLAILQQAEKNVRACENAHQCVSQLQNAMQMLSHAIRFAAESSSSENSIRLSSPLHPERHAAAQPPSSRSSIRPGNPLHPKRNVASGSRTPIQEVPKKDEAPADSLNLGPTN